MAKCPAAAPRLRRALLQQRPRGARQAQGRAARHEDCRTSGICSLAWFHAVLCALATDPSEFQHLLSVSSSASVSSTSVKALKSALICELRHRTNDPQTAVCIAEALRVSEQGIAAATYAGQFVALIVALQTLADLCARRSDPSTAVFRRRLVAATERVRLLPSGSAIGAALVAVRLRGC